MAKAPDSYLDFCGLPSLHGEGEEKGRYRSKDAHRRLGLLVAALLMAPLVFAQGTPRVTSAEPSSGKVNDSVTLAGENLGKSSVSAVFLSDDKTDYMATVVQQAAEKIVMKVPQVKPGDYNVSVQAGDRIFIMPVRFKVQQ
jgi:IPT/TIG domain